MSAITPDRLPVNRPGPIWTPGNDPTPIAILGSTGSVGTQTVDVAAHMPDRIRVAALCARKNIDLLVQQAWQLKPDLIVSSDPALLNREIPAGTRVVIGADGMLEAATLPEIQIVVTATSGHAAIIPTAEAIKAGKCVALANKETIVCAGELILPLAEKHGVALRPVDSEHSAIWQSLSAARGSGMKRLILTASGGPFRTYSQEEIQHATIEQALKHPTWSMGGKITIDSATLMNKGLEVIEAHWLFSMPYEQIDVLVHPESIIHSIVEFADQSQVAQLSLPDMRLPIQYALSYPDHIAGPCKPLSLAEVGSLHFAAPDEARFPALRIAREAGSQGGPYPTILSAADEIAVEAFIAGRIGFPDIAAIVEEMLSRYSGPTSMSFDLIAEVDQWARAAAASIIESRAT
jgi:1-deoxy-D-xylulose-5-phosphate reductoisomerase